MGLFKIKKDDHEQSQTQEIKHMASPQTPSAPSSQAPQQSTPDFQNPFSSQAQQAQSGGNFPPQTQGQTPPNSPLGQSPNPFESPTQTNTQQTPQFNSNPQPTAFENQSQTPPQNNPMEQQSPEFPQNQNQEFTPPPQFTPTPSIPKENSTQSNFNPEQPMPEMDKIQEMIDETVEKIIEEKWKGVTQNVEKVVKWKDRVEQQLNLVKEDLVDIRDNFEKIEKKIMERVQDYDKNILDVNSEIRALEKVFQKITPTLINNVNELSKIAEDFKSVKPKKSQQED